jgi:uncharacterized protein YacL (UPF0231 family)
VNITTWSPILVPVNNPSNKLNFKGFWFVNENTPNLETTVHKTGDCYLVKILAESSLKSTEHEKKVMLEGKELIVRDNQIIRYDSEGWTLLD